MLRRAANRTGVRSAGPALVRLVQAPSFVERSLPEQQRVLAAIHALHPQRSEALLCALVVKHGLVADALDNTHAPVARLRGEWGTTEQAEFALAKAAGRGWWNSPTLREVAAEAAAQ